MELAIQHVCNDKTVRNTTIQDLKVLIVTHHPKKLENCEWLIHMKGSFATQKTFWCKTWWYSRAFFWERSIERRFGSYDENWKRNDELISCGREGGKMSAKVSAKKDLIIPGLSNLR